LVALDDHNVLNYGQTTKKTPKRHCKMDTNDSTTKLDFIRQIVAEDIRAGKWGGRVATRFGNDKVMTNARMSHKQVEKFCKLDSASEMMLKQAMTEFGLSARAHDKICKVARTIADLADAEDIAPEHIAEAISYRKLDRKL